MEEKKAFLAIILCMAVLFMWPYIMDRLYPQQESPKGSLFDSGQLGEEEAFQGEAPTPASVYSRPTSPLTAVDKTADVGLEEEKFDEELITVKTPLYTAVFTSVGGGVKSWKLTEFFDSPDEDSKAFDVAGTVNDTHTLETRIITDLGVSEIPFAVDIPEVKINLTGTDKKELKLVWRSDNGLIIEKKYLFSADSYVVDSRLVVRNLSGTTTHLSLETTLAAVYPVEYPRYHNGPVVYITDDADRQDSDDPVLKGEGPVKWIALEDKYFLSALLPVSVVPYSWVSEVPSIDVASAALVVPVDLPPGKSATFDFKAYLGPKKYDLLIALDAGLEEAIEFGVFSFLAKPFLVVLNFFQRFLYNYGLAIIVLTLVIRAALHPITKRGLNSMREMQKIQPQTNAIRERYKNDKEKLNQELWGLYKRHKVSPFGGCLPMLLQIPVFIALYEVLSVAIELRHAPFILWVTDLSAKDPFYILPVIMGATMYLQQKMTPVAMDKAQAKMMMIFFPIFLTFICMSLPSGLVLYWCVSNFVSVSQQYYINRTTN